MAENVKEKEAKIETEVKEVLDSEKAVVTEKEKPKIDLEKINSRISELEKENKNLKEKFDKFNPIEESFNRAANTPPQPKIEKKGIIKKLLKR